VGQIAIPMESIGGRHHPAEMCRYAYATACQDETSGAGPAIRRYIDLTAAARHRCSTLTSSSVSAERDPADLTSREGHQLNISSTLTSVSNARGKQAQQAQPKPEPFSVPGWHQELQDLPAADRQSLQPQLGPILLDVPRSASPLHSLKVSRHKLTPHYWKASMTLKLTCLRTCCPNRRS
jgi:hypothetical protein